MLLTIVLVKDDLTKCHETAFVNFIMNRIKNHLDLTDNDGSTNL